jgi:hypothetical protein
VKELQGEVDRLAHQQVALTESVETRKAQVSFGVLGEELGM